MNFEDEPKILIYPRVNPYWFQEQGFFDYDENVWIPFRPLPEILEEPGPTNLHHLGISKKQIAIITNRWENVRWPKISKSMRTFYIEKHRSSLRKFKDTLWKQLDPIAGYSRKDMKRKYDVDDELKVDKYGNVLALNAERFSRTAWNIDHIFPFSRFGLSELGNLRIILERANGIVKKARIEQTIDPIEMQIGIRVQQLDDLSRTEGQNFYTFLTRRIRSIQSELETHLELWRKEEEFAENVCDQCKSRQARFVCSHCQQWQFCSRECHEINWRLPGYGHSTNCA